MIAPKVSQIKNNEATPSLFRLITWRIIPSTRKWLPFHDRWPGVMENVLNAGTLSVRVIEMHSPLGLVVLMLGTNDFQSMHPHNAWHSSQGIKTLITSIRRAPI